MSLRLKTILGVACIEAVLLAILLSLTLNYLQTTNYEGLDQRADSTVKLFSSTVKNAVLSFDLATIESFTTELMTNNDVVYVSVLDSNEQTMSDSGQLPSVFQPEILEKSASNVFDGVYDVYAPISESDVVFGHVWIGFDMSRLNAQIDAAKKWSAFIVVGEMLLVALFSYFLGAYLTKRLSELKNAADAIAQGEREIKLNSEGKDELAVVSQAFANMVENLRYSESQARYFQTQLLDANESLEDKVLQRTQDLQSTNERLTQTNNELKTTQDKLVESEKMASIGTMAAGVAHEINNPIGAVKSNVQGCVEYEQLLRQFVERTNKILKTHPDNAEVSQFLNWQKANHFDYVNEDLSDSLRDIQGAVERVIKVVSALQHYSSRTTVARDEFVKVELFDVIAKAINVVAPPKHIKVTLLPSINQQASVWGIETELVTLFSELLKNAVQACQYKTDTPHHDIKLAASTQNDIVLVQIKDSGIGIVSEHSKQIFDPFFTTLKVGEGMGLGLTYAYDIARHHGGDIQVRNNKQGGAVATVWLLTDSKEKQTKQFAKTV